MVRRNNGATTASAMATAPTTATQAETAKKAAKAKERAAKVEKVAKAAKATSQKVAAPKAVAKAMPVNARPRANRHASSTVAQELDLRILQTNASTRRKPILRRLV